MAGCKGRQKTFSQNIALFFCVNTGGDILPHNLTELVRIDSDSSNRRTPLPGCCRMGLTGGFPWPTFRTSYSLLTVFRKYDILLLFQRPFLLLPFFFFTRLQIIVTAATLSQYCGADGEARRSVSIPRPLASL